MTPRTFDPNPSGSDLARSPHPTKSRRIWPGPVLLAAILCVATAQAGEVFSLELRFQKGDRYRLALSAITETSAYAKSGDQRSHNEAVKLDYRAQILVLEVDAEGVPIRERHEAVRLGFERPEESGQLFGSGTSFDVHRGAGAEIQLFANGQRVERRVERIVADLLVDQLEYGPTPALVDPGRPVQIGETWKLDPDRARELLRRSGLRVLEMGADATATLRLAGMPLAGEPGADTDLLIEYTVPAKWVRLNRMPEGARAAESEARLIGEIRVSSGSSTVLAHSSHLEFQLAGVAGRAGAHLNVPWRVERSKRNVQSTIRLDDSLSSRPAALDGYGRR